MGLFNDGHAGVKQISHEQMRGPVPPAPPADVIPTRAFTTKDQVIKLKTAVHSDIVNGIDDPDTITVDVTAYNQAVVHEVEDDLKRSGWDVTRCYGNDRIATLVLS